MRAFGGHRVGVLVRATVVVGSATWMSTH